MNRDFLHSQDVWSGKCPHCGAYVSPAFNLHIGDVCPFCHKLLPPKQVQPNRSYGKKYV